MRQPSSTGIAKTSDYDRDKEPSPPRRRTAPCRDDCEALARRNRSCSPADAARPGRSDIVASADQPPPPHDDLASPLPPKDRDGRPSSLLPRVRVTPATRPGRRTLAASLPPSGGKREMALAAPLNSAATPYERGSTSVDDLLPNGVHFDTTGARTGSLGGSGDHVNGRPPVNDFEALRRTLLLSTLPRQMASSPPPSRGRMPAAAPPPSSASAPLAPAMNVEATSLSTRSRSPSGVGYEGGSSSLANEPPATLPSAAPISASAGVGHELGASIRGRPDDATATIAASSHHSSVDIAEANATETAGHPPIVDAPTSPVRAPPENNGPSNENEGNGNNNDDTDNEEQDMLLDANVEAVAAAPEPHAQRSSSPPPRPPSELPQAEEEEEEEEEPAMLCGVPVARPISEDEDVGGSGDYLEGMASDSDNDEGDGGDVSDFDDLEIAEGGDMVNASAENYDPTMHRHLRYLGHVVVATMDEETLEEGGGGEMPREEEAGARVSLDDFDNDPSRRPSENVSLTQTTTPASIEKISSGGHKMQFWGGIILAALVISGAVGGVLKTRSRADGAGGTDTGPPVEGVMEDLPLKPLPVSLVDNNSALIRLMDPFLQSTGSNAHRIAGTPQQLATEWLDVTSWGAFDHFDLSQWMDAATLPPDLDERLIQRYVLAVLYYSTVGELDSGGEPLVGWKDRAGFLTDAHECDWNSAAGLGTLCDDKLRVTEIVLEKNGLEGTIPRHELHGLSRLRRLDLSFHSNLRGPLPENLGQLQELEILDFSQNSLTGSIPSTYGNLTNLKEFNLADNALIGSVPAEVAGMVSLTNIWLNQNEFTGGMNNFCQEEIPGIILFYSDCFCRTFPRMEPEVDCACCTICCAVEGSGESCHPSVPCIGEDCSYCTR